MKTTEQIKEENLQKRREKGRQHYAENAEKLREYKRVRYHERKKLPPPTRILDPCLQSVSDEEGDIDFMIHIN